MKNKKKLIIIILISIIVIVLLKIFIKPNIPSKIANYLLENGYVANENEYEKQLSILNKEEYDYYVSSNLNVSYSKQTFSLATFRLTRLVEDYQDNVSTSLTETFDYRDNSLIYTYRITGSNMNAIFKGEYKDSEEFNCEIEFSYGLLANNFQTTTCSLIEQQILEFKLDANSLFLNYSFIDYMQNQKKE